MTVIILWLFLTVLWVGLQCVIVVYPDHINFPFFILIPIHNAYFLHDILEQRFIFSYEPNTLDKIVNI